MSTVHPSAAVGFDRASADYERGRPGYPPEAIEILVRELGLGPGSRIVDLAAGTGKLTRALRGLGAQLVAVEPVAGMRAQLRAAVPGVEIHDGTAEHLPFPDAAVDAVLVAQAFHWFDVEAAATEIARVLVPGGGLGVIRNAWDRTAAWVNEMQSLIAERRTGEPSQASSRWQERLEQTGRFSPLSERVIPHVVASDRDALLARVKSVGFVATMAPGERERLLGEVSQILDRHGVAAPGTPLATPYRTHVMWAWRA